MSFFVMPDLISLPQQEASRRHPEVSEGTGFPLEFTPYLMRGGNDEKTCTEECHPRENGEPDDLFNLNTNEEK